MTTQRSNFRLILLSVLLELSLSCIVSHLPQKKQ